MMLFWGIICFVLCYCAADPVDDPTFNIHEHLRGIGSAPFDPIFSVPGGKPYPSSTTVVSGHFVMPFAKHGYNEYRRWWKNTLRLNCPYVFYTNDIEAGKLALEIRHGLPTIIVYKNFSTFFGTNHNVTKRNVQRIHVPSVPLALVWLEKTFLVEDAYIRNYFKSDWFAWVDSGVALYRKIKMPTDPWPNPKALAMLPPKFLYTCKWFPWHAGEIAGSAFVYHASTVVEVTKLWAETFLLCNDDATRPREIRNERFLCVIDQYLLTQVKKRRPDMFYQAGYGYGVIIRELFKDSVPEKNITSIKQVCELDATGRRCGTWYVEWPV